MKRILISILTTLVLVGLTACSATPTENPTITGELMGFQNGILQSKLQRLDSPSTKTTDSAGSQTRCGLRNPWVPVLRI